MQQQQQSTFGAYGTLDRDLFVAGHFHCAENYSTVRQNGRKDWLLTFTLSGEGYFQIGGSRYSAKAGDVILLKDGTPHHYGTTQGEHWQFRWVHFAPDPQMQHLCRFPEQERGFYKLSIEAAAVQERISAALERLMLDTRQQRPYWNMLCASAIHEVLWLLNQHAARRFDPRVEEVLALLSADMKRTLRIADIARTVNLSESRLSHLFKLETGQSVVAALNQIRLREAATLLLHTYRSAAEIADDVGFPNYNHFLNQFKKRYGTSPSQYRSNRQQ
ncbi:helix-turn-helix domain-containing protein [Paenibacillus sp. GCM10027626]|uniref:helix-turn-helix domain-containing protein n=1 Tax=Paenibacillus sp. GCM10027626 TaxID=3273411 RepID=UPI003628088D